VAEVHCQFGIVLKIRCMVAARKYGVRRDRKRDNKIEGGVNDGHGTMCNDSQTRTANCAQGSAATLRLAALRKDESRQGGGS